MVLETTWIEEGSQKCIDYSDKRPFMVIILNNSTQSVWIQHDFAFDPSKCFKKVVVYCIFFLFCCKQKKINPNLPIQDCLKC